MARLARWGFPMAKGWLRRMLGDGGGDVAPGVGGGQNDLPTVAWVRAADNPWGVDVLDVRPVTLTMMSVSSDPTCAENAISYGQDDGRGFAGVEPEVSRVADIN